MIIQSRTFRTTFMMGEVSRRGWGRTKFQNVARGYHCISIIFIATFIEEWMLLTCPILLHPVKYMWKPVTGCWSIPSWDEADTGCATDAPNQRWHEPQHPPYKSHPVNKCKSYPRMTFSNGLEIHETFDHTLLPATGTSHKDGFKRLHCTLHKWYRVD